jgi:dTDP-3,4-didehydro-2,6-dideoxy-alpha-D-glucose 3-reductase
MEKIAIVGFGGHVVKNVIPAIRRSGFLDIESIYVRDPDRYSRKGKEFSLIVRDQNQEIEGDVKWIYIATPISTHYQLAKKYLELGKNVICEKPLTQRLENTAELFMIAEENNLKLHEVCMYKHHKQYVSLKDYVSTNHEKIRAVNTKFTIPHLPKGDIRYNKFLGGGALLDVGYYPISILVSLFGKPESIKSRKYGGVQYEVDLFGCALFDYGDYYCMAEWGIGQPYSNEISIITDLEVMRYERIFSKPDTLVTIAESKNGSGMKQFVIGEDDQFVNMLKWMFSNTDPTPHRNFSSEVIAIMENI